ncbi:major facilitator superfamily domain-containing protein [Kockovaella imperatae]|uniref:Major facilitator superfamily domain-containing protein n=1 Tax=Kockovaella imperatae TaxID=4999 RepID=A0A1Y1UBK2_9TREE|nr:major facilitator superfamily domain-containing protein [Kockovaella imperatae]ORX35382.1 major facilitator superfamily domain-containing protein [Kockovaella imperatae]
MSELTAEDRNIEEPEILNLTKHALFEVSHARRYGLLAVFALSIFIDVSCSSAFLVFTAPIAKDLDIIFAQQSWIITSYSLTFASFFMLWGRLVDLHSPRPVFCTAFAVIGACNLILSFLNDKYGFLILRAIAGVAAAAVVPSSYRLIPMIFPPAERSRAYTLFMMTGSLSNSLAVILAGFFALIPHSGQMSGWRWFFRVFSSFALIGAILGYLLIPVQPKAQRPKRLSLYTTLRRLDIPAIMCIEASIIAIILALTFGASYGWKTPSFLVPFVIGIVLLPTFFVWEHYKTRTAVEEALLPSHLWRIPNFAVLIIFSLVCLGWWAVNFLAFIQWYNEAQGETILLSALRTLPEGLIAICVSVLCIKYPRMISRPRWSIISSMIACIIAYVLWTQAPSYTGLDYWRWVLPGMLIGSAGMQVILLSGNVGIMMTAPPDLTGAVGAVYSMSTQLSVVVALSIQAGMWSVHPGGIHDRSNIRLSFYVELGWLVLWFIGFVIFYRPGKSWDSDEDTAEIESATSKTEQSTIPKLETSSDLDL